nr:4014_t:CDS:10 [Entrophospora candida]
MSKDYIKTNLEWISSLKVNKPAKNNRKTSIICTIGPNTNNVTMLTDLLKAGMNIVRMNFSHGSHEYHGSVMKNTREAYKLFSRRPISLALDTKGPEIRTGIMSNNAEFPIKAGHEMIFSTDEKYAECSNSDVMYIDYKNLAKVIEVDKLIYVDDGVLSFKVLEVHDDHVKVRAVNNGNLSSKKGVNLPDTNVDLPAVSEKDKSDLIFGVKNDIDMIFASFIRCAKDIIEIRNILGKEGADIKVIAKIESQQGVNNFDEILKEADGIMVARGDLGIEIPPSHVFVAQKMMITKCNIAGKPVICATQMLESMTYNPRPTRAEVSDVANAVLDGADCVMLSGETAKGSYPIEAVKMMAETCVMAESVICYPPLFNELRNTARLISKYRPRCPILTVTRNERTARQIHLYRGCYPFIYHSPTTIDGYNWQEDVENRILWGIKKAVELDLIKKGDYVIAIQGWKGGLGNTNTIRILSVP